VRTLGEPADRQKGLSQFIVDLSLPGVTVRPIRDLAGDAHFSEVFFDDVLLSDQALVGSEGSGWAQVNAELAFERSGPERIFSSIVLLEHWIDQLRRGADRNRHAATVGRFATHLATLRNMSIAVTTRLACGESPVIEAALVKDMGTGFEQEIPAVLEALIAEDPRADLDEDLVATVEYLAQVSPTFSLRGGTREILRGMIARGLGLR
jgi:alkylation response protein AidB-like acyl-CoA dehydrogenase